MLSIHKGFREAGLALGFLPPRDHPPRDPAAGAGAVPPPLGNQWIISIKDTSLFIVIGVAELTCRGQKLLPVTSALEIWSAVAVIYLIITGVELILRRLERRMKICD